MPHWINQSLLDEVSAEAKAAPRLRKNRNFHAADDAPAHRLLNAIEPGSYIAPHCHREATKDESIIILRGRLAVVFFDEAGNITDTAVLEPAGKHIGVNIPHGVFHTAFALEPGTVFFESKSGPYRPLQESERVTWAPMEGAPEVVDWLDGLTKRLLMSWDGFSG